mmetsp:Transcript_47996/g.111273  ORF Transcript_47996/g.111273 Transcript_47996/m.111273 type:complete len:85 (+) Transcript_47996:1165-1419(+)
MMASAALGMAQQKALGKTEPRRRAMKKTPADPVLYLIIGSAPYPSVLWNSPRTQCVGHAAPLGPFGAAATGCARGTEGGESTEG